MRQFKAGDKVKGIVTGREGIVQSIAPGGRMTVKRDNGDEFDISDLNAALVEPRDEVTSEHLIKWYGHEEGVLMGKYEGPCICDFNTVIMVTGCVCGGK